MITEAVISLLYEVGSLVVGLVPTTDPPAWVSDVGTYLDQIWQIGDGLGVWIPWTLLAAVTAAVLVCVGVGFAIRLARIVASFLTLGGGAAG